MSTVPIETMVPARHIECRVQKTHNVTEINPGRQFTSSQVIGMPPHLTRMVESNT